MKIEKDQYDLPGFIHRLMDQYGKFAADIHSGKIVPHMRWIVMV